MKDFENSISAIFLIGILITILLQVFVRVVDISLGFTEELSRYLMIWLTFIGISAAIKVDGHLGTTFIYKYLPKRIKAVYPYFQIICFMLLCVIMIILGFNHAFSQFSSGRTWTSVDLPLWIIHVAIPLGFLFSLFRLFQKLRTEGSKN